MTLRKRDREEQTKERTAGTWDSSSDQDRTPGKGYRSVGSLSSPLNSSCSLFFPLLFSLFVLARLYLRLLYQLLSTSEVNPLPALYLATAFSLSVIGLAATGVWNEVLEVNGELV